MAQTIEGALKIAAKRTGVTPEQYEANLEAGFKWCTRGKHWEDSEKFCSDSSRHDGLASSCNRCRQALQKSMYVPRPRKSTRGRRYRPARDGDQRQAQDRIRRLVKADVFKNPNDIPCVDCGHFGNDQTHEYDHHKGYEAENHEAVQARCKRCHLRRHKIKPIVFGGVSKEAAEWARPLGISVRSLRERIEKWPLAKALTTPNCYPNRKFKRGPKNDEAI
jgi:hypothetical protein